MSNKWEAWSFTTFFIRHASNFTRRLQTLKSYIKLYGPPIYKAFKALERIAVDMPEVCIMDTIIEQYHPEASALGYVPSSPEGHPQGGADWTRNYFSPLASITVERCDTIISKSGETLGEYDFYFEWFTEPAMNQINDLIQKIDDTLSPLGVKYTITTK